MLSYHSYDNSTIDYIVKTAYLAVVYKDRLPEKLYTFPSS